MNLAHKLRTFRRMESHDRVLVAQALALTVFISVGMRVIGVPRTQKWLRRWAEPNGRNSTAASAVIARALHAQRIVRRTGGIEGTCLVRSLAVWALLRKRGIVTELRIGVRKREGAIEAHAWVEREGIPLNEQAGIVSQYQIYGEPVDFDRWV